MLANFDAAQEVSRGLQRPAMAGTGFNKNGCMSGFGFFHKHFKLVEAFGILKCSRRRKNREMNVFQALFRQSQVRKPPQKGETRCLRAERAPALPQVVEIL